MIIGEQEDISSGGDLYLRRWILFRCWLFGIYLHQFHRSDEDRAMHDHPWPSVTLVLRGGYFEHTPAGVFWRRPGALVARKATDRHRVELVTTLDGVPAKAWTLFFIGPKRREWGFWTERGWVHNKNFSDSQTPARMSHDEYEGKIANVRDRLKAGAHVDNARLIVAAEDNFDELLNEHDAFRKKYA